MSDAKLRNKEAVVEPSDATSANGLTLFNQSINCQVVAKSESNVRVDRFLTQLILHSIISWRIICKIAI